MKTGILLINLGTPDAPNTGAVRKYLREFLLDPRVVDLPFLLRLLLIYSVILPFRSPRSAKLYQKIWTEKGSPLLIHSKNFATALQKKLGDRFLVEIGMRYGNPSIASGLHKLLAQCRSIHISPLFPQYSEAATGSALENTLKILQKESVIPDLHIISKFFDHPKFISAVADVTRPILNEFKPDFLLMSYHGLPERQNQKMKNTRYFCYQTQCLETSKLLAAAVQLNETQYTTSFQSRLGRIPWIKPYTDEMLPQLYQQGVRRLAIICPSFVADCLETLEEIGIRAREQWMQLGGEAFCLIPCLNSSAHWVEAFAEMHKSFQS